MTNPEHGSPLARYAVVNSLLLIIFTIQEFKIKNPSLSRYGIESD